MATEKTLNSRIINKHDTEFNWLKATGFRPKAGELIVYDIDDTHDYERLKIGNGGDNVKDLPFLLEGGDDNLSFTSKNAVQNKVVTTALEDKPNKKDLRDAMKIALDRNITEGVKSVHIDNSYETEVYTAKNNYLPLTFSGNINGGTTWETGFSLSKSAIEKTVYDKQELHLLAGTYYFNVYGNAEAAGTTNNPLTGEIIFYKKVYENKDNLEDANYIFTQKTLSFKVNTTYTIDLAEDIDYISMYVSRPSANDKVPRCLPVLCKENLEVKIDDKGNGYSPIADSLRLRKPTTNLFPYPFDNRGNSKTEFGNMKVVDNGDGTITVKTISGTEETATAGFSFVLLNGVETEYPAGDYTFVCTPEAHASNKCYTVFSAFAVDGDSDTVFEGANKAKDNNGPINFTAAPKLGSMTCRIYIAKGCTIPATGITFKPQLVKGTYTSRDKIPAFQGYGERNLVWKYSKNMARPATPKIDATEEGIIVNKNKKTAVYDITGFSSSGTKIIYNGQTSNAWVKGTTTNEEGEEITIYTLTFSSNSCSIVYNSDDETLTFTSSLTTDTMTVYMYGYVSTGIVYGLTLTYLEGGSYLINGTTTSDAVFDIRTYPYNLRPHGQVVFSGAPEGCSESTYYMNVDYNYSNGDTVSNIITKDNPAISDANKTLVSYSNTKIVIKKGTVCNNVYFYYQLELGIKPTAFSRFYMPFIMSGEKIQTTWTENTDKIYTLICESDVNMEIVQYQKVKGEVDLASNQIITGVKTFEKQVNIGKAALTYDETNERLVISFLE